MIFALSFFAWRCRIITFRLLCLTTFLWISATALRSRRERHRVAQSVVPCWCNSRRQLLDCLAHRVFKVVQPLPVQSPAQGGTDVSTGQSKFDVIHLVNHRVLGAFRSVFGRQKIRRGLTLIVVRITLTEPKAAEAGVILEISFARLKASMAAVNAETVFSRPLGRLDSMVGMRGEGAARRL